jgi:hypothetical protein
MFEKLYLLVKNNAGTAVISNPAVPEKYHEAVINDATSTIIEVLKGQMESGKLKDLVNYFQFSSVHNNPLISGAVRKFANKLNNFYNIGSVEAMVIANEVIPPVMQEMIKESKGENKEFSLGALLAKVSGNLIDDMTVLLNQLSVA